MTASDKDDETPTPGPVASRIGLIFLAVMMVLAVWVLWGDQTIMCVSEADPSVSDGECVPRFSSFEKTALTIAASALFMWLLRRIFSRKSN
ncbi:hypothetical protein [Timonella sp. A28]|uniref:hypothetical protein n=1 Tax=Timonella sp. A28 TaxID=3442640 RepID=UPI003EBF189C